MDNRFSLLQVQAEEAATHLKNNGYSESPAAIVHMDADECPSRIIIDTEGKQFWFVDEAAIAESRETIKGMFDQEIGNLTLKEIEEWAN